MDDSFEDAARDLVALVKTGLPPLLLALEDAEIPLPPMARVEVAMHLRDEWPNCEVQWIATRWTNLTADDECDDDETDLSVEHEFNLDFEIVGGDTEEDAVRLYFAVARYNKAARAALSASTIFVHSIVDAQLIESGVLQDQLSVLLRRWFLTVRSRLHT
jgi:hypothetical protein